MITEKSVIVFLRGLRSLSAILIENWVCFQFVWQTPCKIYFSIFPRNVMFVNGYIFQQSFYNTCLQYLLLYIGRVQWFPFYTVFLIPVGLFLCLFWEDRVIERLLQDDRLGELSVNFWFLCPIFSFSRLSSSPFWSGILGLGLLACLRSKFCLGFSYCHRKKRALVSLGALCVTHGIS